MKVKNFQIKKWQKISAVILVITLLIGLFVFFFYNSKLNKIHYNFDSKVKVDTKVEIPVDNSDIVIPDLYQGDPNNSIVAPQGDIFKDTNILNILLLGTDERTTEFSQNARADSIMILSLNKSNHSIKLISLERAIGVPIEGRSPDWLTHTFRYGGPYLTLNTVKNCFKVDVDKFIRVNFNTFTQILDYVGGVDMEITSAEAKALNGQFPNEKLVTGINHLDAEVGLQFSRLRKIDSDWQRIIRQRKVMKAIFDKAKGYDVLKLNSMSDQVLPLVETNLAKNEISQLILEIPKFKNAQLGQMTIPTKGTYWSQTSPEGRNLIAVDFNKNAKAIADFLSK